MRRIDRDRDRERDSSTTPTTLETLPPPRFCDVWPKYVRFVLVPVKLYVENRPFSDRRQRARMQRADDTNVEVNQVNNLMIWIT
jgi:hypothetical protein